MMKRKEVMFLISVRVAEAFRSPGPHGGCSRSAGGTSLFNDAVAHLEVAQDLPQLFEIGPRPPERIAMGLRSMVPHRSPAGERPAGCNPPGYTRSLSGRRRRHQLARILLQVDPPDTDGIRLSVLSLNFQESVLAEGPLGTGRSDNPWADPGKVVFRAKRERG